MGGVHDESARRKQGRGSLRGKKPRQRASGCLENDIASADHRDRFDARRSRSDRFETRRGTPKMKTSSAHDTRRYPAMRDGGGRTVMTTTARANNRSAGSAILLDLAGVILSRRERHNVRASSAATKTGQRSLEDLWGKQAARPDATSSRARRPTHLRLGTGMREVREDDFPPEFFGLNQFRPYQA